MQNPSALVVTANPVLGNIYRQWLEAAGLEVHVAPDGESALAHLAQSSPNLLALDLLLPGMDGVELIRTVHSQQGYNGIPIFVMPTIDAALLESAQQAGITRVLDRQPHPASILADTGRRICHISHAPGQPPMHRGIPAGTMELITRMRSALHNITREPNLWSGWKTFALEAHHVAEAMALSGEGAMGQLAFAVEALALDISRMPEQSNVSVLRTLSQACDFLAILLQHPERMQLERAGAGKVLIVDDEPSALQLISAAMQFVGLQSATAPAPSAALTTARGEHFDLIFLDVGLPEMNGFDLCTQVRSTPGHYRTPIVFLTGMATFANRAQSSLSGGNDFIGKPFHLLELGVKALIWLQRGRLKLL